MTVHENLNYWDFILRMHRLGVQFDSNERRIELFPSGGIKFYANENGLDIEDFEHILFRIWNKDILDFKIIGSFHSEKLENYLKKFKYPLINRYKTKKILDDYGALINQLENRSVIRCKGQIVGREFLNLILIESLKHYRDSDAPRNKILQEFGENIGSQTNFNKAFSGEVKLSYELDDFIEIAPIIFGFIEYLRWHGYLSLSRITIYTQRVTLFFNRLSNLSKEFFYQDWEKKIHSSKFKEDGVLINDLLWSFKDDTISSHFFHLVTSYFAINRVTSVRLPQLGVFIDEIKFKYLKPEKLTVDNARNTYIPKINEEFSKVYEGKILDITGDLVEAKKLKNYKHLNPIDN